jgi:hypothetical protein
MNPKEPLKPHRHWYLQFDPFVLRRPASFRPEIIIDLLNIGICTVLISAGRLVRDGYVNFSERVWYTGFPKRTRCEDSVGGMLVFDRVSCETNYERGCGIRCVVLYQIGWCENS